MKIENWFRIGEATPSIGNKILRSSAKLLEELMNLKIIYNYKRIRKVFIIDKRYFSICNTCKIIYIITLFIVEKINKNNTHFNKLF